MNGLTASEEPAPSGRTGPAPLDTGQAPPAAVGRRSGRRNAAGTAPEQPAEQFSYVAYPFVARSPSDGTGVPAGFGGGAVVADVVAELVVAVAWVVVVIVAVGVAVVVGGAVVAGTFAVWIGGAVVADCELELLPQAAAASASTPTTDALQRRSVIAVTVANRDPRSTV